MKRAIYVLLFTILGVLLSFIFYAITETVLTILFARTYKIFGTILAYHDWRYMADSAAIVFFLGGTIFGFWQGMYWWRIIYIEKRYSKKLKRHFDIRTSMHSPWFFPNLLLIASFIYQFISSFFDGYGSYKAIGLSLILGAYLFSMLGALIGSVVSNRKKAWGVSFGFAVLGLIIFAWWLLI